MRRLLPLLLFAAIGGVISAAHASPSDQFSQSASLASEHFTAIARIGLLPTSAAVRSCSYELAARIGSPVAYNSSSGSHVEFAVRSSPNPFYSSAIVVFHLPTAARVKVGLFDVTGREVAKIADGYFTSGHHDVPFPARSAEGARLPTGVYFLRTVSGEFTVTQRVALIQ